MNETRNNELLKGRFNHFLQRANDYQDFFTPLFSFIDDKTSQNSLMRTDIEETKDNYTLLVEVPGVKKMRLKSLLKKGI